MRPRKHPYLKFSAVLIATISLVAVGLWARFDSSKASAAAADKVIYSQQSGKNGSYLQYVPGDGSKVTTQSVTGGGGCATPNTSNPVLAFSANWYPNGYGAAPSPAIVGAYNNRTGVCQVPQAWSVEVGEGLDFAPGPNALTAGRLFVEASVILEREDKTATPSVNGQLVATLAGTPVATKTFSINGGSGTQATVDTSIVPTGFDKIELQVTAPSTGSVSVVGPFSTFTLAGKICPGGTLDDTSTGGTAASGEVSAHFLYVAGSGCKSVTYFAASSTDPTSTNGKSVTFDSAQLTGAHLSSHFDWGYFPMCRADGTTVDGIAPCPTTYVDFGDGVDHPETFCAAASTTTPWCVTSRTVNYVVVNGVTVAHIVEDWDGLGDVIFRYR